MPPNEHVLLIIFSNLIICTLWLHKQCNKTNLFYTRPGVIIMLPIANLLLSKAVDSRKETFACTCCPYHLVKHAFTFHATQKHLRCTVISPAFTHNLHFFTVLSFTPVVSAVIVLKHSKLGQNLICCAAVQLSVDVTCLFVRHFYD